MAFCTTCGKQVSDDARFCNSCGAAMPGGAGGPIAAAFAPARAPLMPLDYTIHGDNLQVARLKLKPGQEVFAEAGKMLYKTQTVQWETKMQGDSIGQKLWGALKRKVMGESLFMTHFIATALLATTPGASRRLTSRRDAVGSCSGIVFSLRNTPYSSTSHS
jgi:hypothetical protein